MPKLIKVCKKDECSNTFESWPSSNKRYCSPDCRYTDPDLVRLLGSSIKTKHSLSEINPLELTALCYICGFTDIRARTEKTKFPLKSVKYRCRTAERTRDRAIYFRLSKADLEYQLEVQNFQCAICKTSLNNKSLRVDHDHKCCEGRNSCGQCLRGLLCNRCNTLLGLAKDDVDALKRAIQYLSDWPWEQN